MFWIYKIVAMSGMVTIDINVDINVICAIKVSSPPYSTHNMVPAVAAGMADIITASPTNSESYELSPLNAKYITTGVRITHTSEII